MERFDRELADEMLDFHEGRATRPRGMIFERYIRRDEAMVAAEILREHPIRYLGQ